MELDLDSVLKRQDIDLQANHYYQLLSKSMNNKEITIFLQVLICRIIILTAKQKNKDVSTLLDSYYEDVIKSIFEIMKRPIPCP